MMGSTADSTHGPGIGQHVINHLEPGVHQALPEHRQHVLELLVVDLERQALLLEAGDGLQLLLAALLGGDPIALSSDPLSLVERHVFRKDTLHASLLSLRRFRRSAVCLPQLVVDGCVRRRSHHISRRLVAIHAFGHWIN